jgi:hypothetical protein
VAPGPATGVAHPPAAGQAAAKAALYRSLIWYGLLTAVLLVVWAMSSRDYFWPIWPILGFLIAIGWQAFAVYGPGAVDDDRRPPASP